MYRLTREVWLNDSDDEIREFVYQHDAVGNVTSIADNTIDPVTTTRTAAGSGFQFAYDDRDRLQFEMQSIALS